MLFVKSPVFYNIQREIFGEMFADHGKGFLRYIPDKIPENAGDYTIRCSPRFLQAEAYFEISYVTSPEQLEEYRNFAEANGAKKRSQMSSIIKHQLTNRQKYGLFRQQRAIQTITNM